MVEEVEGYNTDALITFLNGKNFGLNENEIQIIRDQGIDGASFLMLNEERFKECNIRMGPRAKLVNWINNLNDQKQPGATERPKKKPRIEQDWKSYKASDACSVELPSQIFDMLESNEFVPEPRTKYAETFLNLNAGESIIPPNLGQEPKHFAVGYQGKRFFVTEQMINIWGKISADKGKSIKHVLSGPMGVGKSYISYFLASKAYASGWITLYIADASELVVDSPIRAGEVICKYFLAMNKDILSATDLKNIVRYADSDLPVRIVADNILDFLKTSNRKSLLIIDEHGALFESDPPIPIILPLLSPLMNLNYWVQHYKFARVVFTGTAHAKFEKEHLTNGTKKECLIFVVPLESNIFDELLKLHNSLNESSIIRKEVKRITNSVPRELVHLVDYIDKGKSITDMEGFLQALKKYEEERVDEILASAQQYYKSIQSFEKINYYLSLTRMFLPSLPPVQFDWEFLDLGLIYRYEEEGVIHSLPLCPSAQKALIKMYITGFDIPESVKNQLRLGELDGLKFEEVLFNRLVSGCNSAIQLETTDLANSNKNIITLQFKDYGLIKRSQLSLGFGNDKILGHGFDGYPRFDYVLGSILIQVSVSDFVTHNKKESTDIRTAFKKPMSRLYGISELQINGRNQIEMYLDEIYGPSHSASIDSSTNKFIVTKNNVPVPGFRIVYFCGKPGPPNHTRKVHEFPDVAHVTLDEIKEQLFRNII